MSPCPPAPGRRRVRQREYERRSRQREARIRSEHPRLGGLILALRDDPVPVRGALCFVGPELPWFSETIRGIPLVGRRGLAKLLTRPGDLGDAEREAVAQYLDSRFPPAQS